MECQPDGNKERSEDHAFLFVFWCGESEPPTNTLYTAIKPRAVSWMGSWPRYRKLIYDIRRVVSSKRPSCCQNVKKIFWLDCGVCGIKKKKKEKKKKRKKRKKRRERGYPIRVIVGESCTHLSELCSGSCYAHGSSAQCYRSE